VVPLMSVAENLTLHDPPRRRGMLDFRARSEIVGRVAERLAFDFDLDQPISNLSVAQMQLVEIGKALAFDSKVLVLDEPTASLTDAEAERLFSVIEQLRDNGHSIVFVSHKLEEVFAICDRVTILRDGESVVESALLSDFSKRDVVAQMVGRELKDRPTRHRVPDRSREPILRLEALSTELGHHEVSLSLHSGEILGMYGLVGAGRSELARSVLGLHDITAGDILVDGQQVTIGSVGEALREYSIGYVTEDRKGEGLFLDKTVRFNVAATVWRKISTWFGVSEKLEQEVAQDAIKRLWIKVANDRQLTGQLSGGNQQKVSLSKWLAAKTRVLIIDEPTVGVDVRTKAEFQELLMDLAEDGMAILLIDSDLTEMVLVADRILVMHDYEVVALLDNSKDYPSMSTAILSAIHRASGDAESETTSGTGNDEL